MTTKTSHSFNNSPDGLLAWLDSVRGTSALKVLTGLRGVGKSRILSRWRDHLIATGVPEDHVVCVDAEEPILRHLGTQSDVLAYFRTQLPTDGTVYILLDEPAAFPDFEIILESLRNNPNHDVYVTLSSRRLLEGTTSGSLPRTIAHREILPSISSTSDYENTDKRSYWNEIMLRDVLSGGRTLDASLVERIAAHLSDNVGTPLSLRTVSAAVSPQGHILSPNTINAYVDALVGSCLVERAYRYDEFTGNILRTNYRIFFTDPRLRFDHFGPAPEDEERRQQLNSAWLELRHLSPRVYVPKEDREEYDLLAVVDGYMRPFKCVNGHAVAVSN